MATTRRAALTGAAAAALTAALPVAAPCEATWLVRSMLLFSIVGMADELAAATGRGEPPERLTSWYGYGLHLAREDLRLFDRGEGAWRDLYRLPMVPGAFTGSAAELEGYSPLLGELCTTAA